MTVHHDRLATGSTLNRLAARGIGSDLLNMRRRVRHLFGRRWQHPNRSVRDGKSLSSVAVPTSVRDQNLTPANLHVKFT